MANIVVTGAARGIALELVKQHAAKGDTLFAMPRDAGSADELNELATQSDGKITVIGMDVGDDASVKAAAGKTGGVPIDIVYNVAGIVGKIEPQLESTDWEDFDNAINIMLKGPLRVLNVFMPQLREGSKIINFSSQLAASTWPYGGFYSYVAAKAGLNRMMRSVAIDLKDRGIVVGLIHPGYVQTDMGGPSADITPEDSATGVREMAEAWTLEQSGDFYKWDKTPHAW